MGGKSRGGALVGLEVVGGGSFPLFAHIFVVSFGLLGVPAGLRPQQWDALVWSHLVYFAKFVGKILFVWHRNTQVFGDDSVGLFVEFTEMLLFDVGDFPRFQNAYSVSPLGASYGMGAATIELCVVWGVVKFLCFVVGLAFGFAVGLAFG